MENEEISKLSIEELKDLVDNMDDEIMNKLKILISDNVDVRNLFFDLLNITSEETKQIRKDVLSSSKKALRKNQIDSTLNDENVPNDILETLNLIIKLYK